MKKTIGLIVVLLIVLVMLTGCVNINYEVKVNKNGSGEISYIYAFSKDTLKSLQVPVEDMVKSMKEQAEKNNYLTEMYEDDATQGFKATKHIDNLLEEFSLQEAFGEEYVKEDEKVNNGINIKNSLFKTKISQSAKIDLTQMKDVASMVAMKYTVKLPVKVKSSNATSISKDGKILTWDLIGGEENKIEFTGAGINVLPIIIIIVIVLVVIAGLVLGIIFFKKKKGTK